MPDGSAPVSISSLATILLTAHGKLFGAATLRDMLNRSNLKIKPDSAWDQASLEWLYAGAFVFVDGVQRHFHTNHNVGLGVAVAREFLSQVERHLVSAGISSPRIAREIDERIRGYERTDMRNGHVEFTVVAAVTGNVPTFTEGTPANLSEYEFSIQFRVLRQTALDFLDDLFHECEIAL